jgi:hypothetical protein
MVMTKRKSWALRIAEAEARGKFTTKEHSWANRSWLTCAVGEKNNWHSPRWNSNDNPYALPEWRLGIDFGYAVVANNIPEAKRIYEEIMALDASH